MTNSIWNQIYTKLLPPACKENNGEKSIDLHLSTIKTSATHLNLIGPVPSDNQGLHRKIRISILGLFGLCSISAKNNAPVVFQRKICTVCRECKPRKETRSIWLNCALRDDEAVYWVSIGHYEAVAVGNWWCWVSRGHSCLYTLHKVEILSGVTDAWRTDSLIDFKR